jgi:hypothetical protein
LVRGVKPAALPGKAASRRGVKWAKLLAVAMRSNRLKSQQVRWANLLAVAGLIEVVVLTVEVIGTAVAVEVVVLAGMIEVEGLVETLDHRRTRRSVNRASREAVLRRCCWGGGKSWRTHGAIASRVAVLRRCCWSLPRPSLPAVVQLDGQSAGHFQGVRAVVMIGSRELL